MKKILLFPFLFILLFAKAQAAPYHLDAPIESYTWGESIKTVWDSRPDDNSWQRASEDIIFVMPADRSSFLLRFWNGKLIGISGGHSGKEMTAEKKDALYSSYLKDFTEKWGKPGPEKPCVANAAICSEVIWHVSTDTQVSLHQSTAESDRLFVGYNYSSREMLPKYQQEIRDLGIKYKAEDLSMIFRQNPESAPKIMKGERVRLEALVESTAPLILADKGNKINATLRNSKDAQSLRRWQIVMISGVLEDVKNDTVYLSDVIFAPYPREGGMVVDRGGKPPKGFFAVETLNGQLEMASSQVERNFSIRDYLLAPRLQNKRAIVDFVSEEVSSGVSFSLEALYADKSSDTLSFNIHMKENQRKPHGYFVLGMVSIILKVSQPDVPMGELWRKIEGVIKEQGDGERGKGKKIVINGWTYQSDIKDERNFTFSVTAPKVR